MRKVNKKILVIALSLMLVACAFVTILSFSMAADGDNGGAAPTVDAKPAFDVVTYTNIDRIIEKSHESGDDHYFRIVEVTSGAASAMSSTRSLTSLRLSLMLCFFMKSSTASVIFTRVSAPFSGASNNPITAPANAPPKNAPK